MYNKICMYKTLLYIVKKILVINELKFQIFIIVPKKMTQSYIADQLVLLVAIMMHALCSKNQIH